MAFAVAGLLSQNGVVVSDPECVAVSFPDFPRWLKTLAVT
jgi:5-enolpyruvylshikimate-3-phosphate synthase